MGNWKNNIILEDEEVVMMGEQQNEKEKVSIADIYENVIKSFKQSTYIMYSPDNHMEITKFTRTRTSEEITRALWQNVITESDMLLIYAVHLLGISTIGSIISVLECLKKQNPELVVPDVDQSGVRSRLQVCCENGMIHSIHNEHEDGTVFKLYYVTESGFCIIRKKLMRHIYGDRYLGAGNLTDMYGIAASAYVVQSLLQYTDYKSVSISFSEIEKTAQDKKCTIPITHVIHFDGADKKKNIYAVEPMYLEHNKAVIVEKNLLELRRKKIRDLGRWLFALSGENVNVKVILVCENIENAIKISKMVTNEAPFMEDKVLYTSERLIREFERNGLERYACLRVEKKEGKRILALGDFRMKFQE